jgi:hypothetical protein
MYPSVSLLPSDQWSERDSITSQEKEAISHFINLSKTFSFRACGVLPMENNKDCKYIYGFKTDVETIQTFGSLALYPNPVNNELNINYQISTGVQIYIYDMQGSLVLNKQLDSQILDVNELNAGVYSIVLMDGNRVLKSRFIKL